MAWLIYLISIMSSIALAKQPVLASANVQNQSAEQAQLDYLNEQIEQLENERDRYRSKAVRAQDQGDRLQFENGMLTDARRYWQFAQSCNEIAAKIDEQVQILKKQRNELIQQMKKKN